MSDYLPQRMGYLRKQWPGMNPREVVVFNNWLNRHWMEYTAIDFNVRCGNGADPLPTFTDTERHHWKLSTQKRIDALAWINNDPTIIEVKDRAGLSAIGQIVSYGVLWTADNPTANRPKLLLVYNRTDSDVLLTASAAGVTVEAVEADFAGLKRSITS